MFWKIFPTRLLLLGLLSASLMVGAFYLILSRGVSELGAEEVLHRKQVYARANAVNIQSFFEALGKSVTLRAQLTAIENGDSTTVERMDDFVDQWGDSGIVEGIILTDREGIVAFHSNVSGIPDIGADVSDMDYFVWAKGSQGEGEYFVGEPIVSRFGTSKGRIIVPVASPVFKDSIFWGVLVAAVKIEPLTQRYLNLMKISAETDIYLIDRHNEVLFSTPNSQVLGSKVKAALILGEEGHFKESGRLIVYSPISLGEQKWLVVMVAPLKEAFDLTVPFYVRHAAILVVVALITLVFGIIVNRESPQPR